MILVLKIFVSHFWTEKFLAPLLTVYIFRSVIVLQECDQMLGISTLETNLIGGKAFFPDQFKNIIYHSKQVAYAMDIMRQCARLVEVNSYGFLINCTMVGH